jgi:hypothetical protein
MGIQFRGREEIEWSEIHAAAAANSSDKDLHKRFGARFFGLIRRLPATSYS